MASFVVEYAKSARSACKHCKLELAKGEMRIGIVSKRNGFNMTSWHHSKCVVELEPSSASQLLNAKGFTALKASDQNLLQEILKLGESRGQKRRLDEDTDSALVVTKSLQAQYDKELWEEKLKKFNSSKLSSTFKGATIPTGWKAFESIIFNEVRDPCFSEKVAGFDFDGCLANTNVKRYGAEAWSLLYPSIPSKLQSYHEQGYKLVVFTNESNITIWTKNRQKAVDSKLGRLNSFLSMVKAPVQVLVACGREGTGDPCRKPAPGMWEFMERHLNNNVPIDRSRSFYVGDAAGRAGDHSAADLGFAKAVGVDFFVPEAIF